MSKHDRFPLITVSALAIGLLLASCSSKDKGESEPAKVAGPAAPASTPSPMAVAPTVYTPESTATVITTCNIEGFDGASFQSVPTEAMLSAKHVVSGWVAAPHLTASSFWLRLDDKVQGHYFQVQVMPSVKRPDVASSASNPPLPLDSGFMLDLPANAVPAGQYHLYMAAQAEGKSSVCDNGRQVDFK